MNTDRRHFLRLLGGGVVTSVGLSETVVAQETPTVELNTNYFDPIGLFVESGTTVRFEISAGTHSVTAYPDRIPNGATPFDSGTFSHGSFDFTFETPGTYDYYCIPHRSIGMVGRIVVGDPGGPAETSPIPDGEIPDSPTIVDEGTVPYGSFTDGSEYSSGETTHEQGSHLHGSVPIIGGSLGAISVAGGGLYWAFGRGNTDSDPEDPALAILRNRYARGEINDEEFQRRRARLAPTENDPT